MPGAANPQAFNRYSYVLNNPIRYNDPTGHMCSDPEDESPTCDGSSLQSTKVGNKVVQGSGLDAGKPKNKPKKHKGGGNLPVVIVLPNTLPPIVDLSPSQPFIPIDLWELIYDNIAPGSPEEFALHCMQGLNPEECLWDPPILGWEGNGTNLAIDTVSFVASFFALNSVTNSLKLAPQATKNAMTISDGLSGLNSLSQGDWTGAGLAVAGYFPIVGIYASAASVLRDLTSGVYEVKPYVSPYIPQPPLCGSNYP